MSTKVEDGNSEIVDFKWKTKRGTGGNKKFQFYESFTYDGLDYSLYDSVYLYMEGELEPYIGKLIKIWESPDKMKKVKVLWFFRPSEISNWLGDGQTLENELFLASGEGVGLANVNPLEAIAGKCNVVCTSKDKRNPQPSREALQEADYIFFRTFDVEHCKISNEIDEKIAGVEVKYLFNRKQSIVLGNVRQPVLDMTTEVGSTEEFSNKLSAYEGHQTEKRDGSVSDSVVNNVSGLEVSVAGVGSAATVKEEHVAVGMDILSSEAGFHRTKCKVNTSPTNQASNEDVVKPTRIYAKEDIAPFDRSHLASNVDSFEMLGNANKRRLNQALDGAKMKSSKSFSLSDDKTSKKTKVDNSLQSSQENGSDDLNELSVDWDAKSSMVDRSSHDNMKFKGAQDSPRPTIGPSKRLKANDDSVKFGNRKSLEASSRESMDGDIGRVGQLIEVTPRPIEDSSRWFKGPPWEEKMRTAHKQGALVLLQNLNPAYTSAEVEDIVWHGLEESCTAKMIQRTAISSPHCGQAYAVFKSREIAEKVIRVLSKGCLMLPNGRPLVASFGTPNLQEKNFPFPGHLTIDNVKLWKQRVEMRQAVSTSHCSQPNTIQYEMAMDWKLLQARSEEWWTRLYKTHEEQLRKLKARPISK